jgi:Uma2 family endonuclease
MSTLHRPELVASKILPLHDGQHLDRATFLALYEQAAPHVKAELVGGVVHMGSPVGWRHGKVCIQVGHWLSHYCSRTTGQEAFGEVTVVLDERGVPQPDSSLRVLPEYGGLGHYSGKILGGAPELVVEFADSSRPLDLGEKQTDYERAGVIEYVVVALDPDEVFWYLRRGNQFERFGPDSDGLIRSPTFPGLWLDPNALLNHDVTTLIATLDRGLATAAHADFVAALAAKVRPQTLTDEECEPEC